MQAIDMHVHIRTGDRKLQDQTAIKDAAAYFGTGDKPLTPDALADYYRRLDMRAVVFDVDSESISGQRIDNGEIAAICRTHPDVFIGFASLDPWRALDRNLAELDRCALELGLRGLKLHPNVQQFFPDDPRIFPIYARCAELGLPVIFHTGTTGIGAGAPGGRGIRLKYSRPIPHLDDIAAEFPDLTIIGAHPSWPWQEEMLAVARHKANVYIDLSGWAPRHFPPSLVQYARTILQDKCLFGSDSPFLTPDRWLKEFDELQMPPAVRQKILLENARRLLKLDGTEPEPPTAVAADRP